MYYFLTEAVQRLFTSELRRFWQYHPEYQGIVDKIIGKYSFRERPQMGIIVKNSSGNMVGLSGDNFQGTVMSYVYLAHVDGKLGMSVEWVRENYRAIQANQGFFPSPPGIYYLDFCDENGTPTDTSFYVDPLLDVAGESVLTVDPTHGQLQNPFVAGTLRLWKMPGDVPLVPSQFTADPTTGSITLHTALEGDEFLSADYRYPGETTGPWAVQPGRALIEPIPGAVLAFGRRIWPGDRLAVVVQSSRQLAALEYGGRWELGLDFDVIARDVNAQREILDLSTMYLWSVVRPRLSSMGIEIMNVSLGGESEEAYDENADDYFYTGSFSIQIQTDWSVQVPLGIVIQRVDTVPPNAEGGPATPPQYLSKYGLSDDQISQAMLQFQVVEGMGLNPFDPFFTGKIGNLGRMGTGEKLL